MRNILRHHNDCKKYHKSVSSQMLFLICFNCTSFLLNKMAKRRADLTLPKKQEYKRGHFDFKYQNFYNPNMHFLYKFLCTV